MKRIVDKIVSFFVLSHIGGNHLITIEQKLLRKMDMSIPNSFVPTLYQSCIARPSLSRFITQMMAIFLVNQIVTVLVMPFFLAFIISFCSTFALGYVLVLQSKKVWHSIFEKKFSAAFNIVADAVQSGVPLEIALNLAGEELGEPIKEVFEEIVCKLKIGIPLDEILEREKIRIDDVDFILFCSALSIGFRTGGNTSDLVKRLQEIINVRKELQNKIVTLTEEAKSNGIISMMIPIGMFGFICYRSPEARDFFLHNEYGKLLAIVAIALIIGNFTVVKILTRKRTL